MKRFVKLSILLVLVASVLLCSWVLVHVALEADQQEREIAFREGTYTMNAQTILQALRQGQVDAFTPQVATPEIPSSYLPPVQWGQEEYSQIADAFYRSIWGEPLTNWNIREVFFRLDCKDAMQGLQYASFDFFIVHDDNGEKASRLERSLFIDPRRNVIQWIEAEYYPNFYSGAAINLTQVKVPGEDALRLAESKGGQGFRLKVDNDCRIYISLVAPIEQDGWLVTYSSESTVFKIRIDEQTGEYQIENK